MSHLIEIKTYMQPQDAYIERGLLESEGIETFLQDELTIQVNPFYSNALGGVKLQVKEEDVERAMDILNITKENGIGPESEVLVIDEGNISDEKKCPFCYSSNIGKMTSGNWLTYIPFLIIGFIFPIYKRSYKCFDCEKRWMIRKHPVLDFIKRHKPQRLK